MQIGGGQNFNEHILRVIKSLMRESREDRLQPFNEYRKKFGLKPYSSFSELTGKKRKTKLFICFTWLTVPILSLTYFFKIMYENTLLKWWRQVTICTFYYYYYCLFSDNEEIARGLEELYGDIDALEFYPGLILEKTRSNRIFGESMVEMGSPFSLKGLFGNPICSAEYWKPSTFGGETGFNIVKTATLRKLVCLNTKWCPYVAFNVPQDGGEPKLKSEL